MNKKHDWKNKNRILIEQEIQLTNNKSLEQNLQVLDNPMKTRCLYFIPFHKNC